LQQHGVLDNIHLPPLENPFAIQNSSHPFGFRKQCSKGKHCTEPGGGSITPNPAQSIKWH
jgi:hypothetical protein